MRFEILVTSMEKRLNQLDEFDCNPNCNPTADNEPIRDTKQLASETFPLL